MKRVLLFFFLILLPDGLCAGETVQAIRDRGTLRCGVPDTGSVLVYKDGNGPAQGFGADLCRALAIALLGSSQKAEIIPAPPDTAAQRLADKEIDVISLFPMTMAGDTIEKMDFPVPVLYSHLAFLAPFNPKARSMKDYREKRVCFASAFERAESLTYYTQNAGLSLRLLPFNSFRRTQEFLFLKRCDLLAETEIFLHDPAFQKTAGADLDLVILPEEIQTVIFSPAVSEGDPEWQNIVRWVYWVLIKAEEKGLTSSNLVQRQSDKDPEVIKILSGSSLFAKSLGLNGGFAVRILEEIGNYGELFNRTLTPFKIDRGKNVPVSEGGLLFTPPFY